MNRKHVEKIGDLKNPEGNVKEQIEGVYRSICSRFEKLDLESVLGYFSDRDDLIKISNGIVLRGKKQLSEYWHKRLNHVKGFSIAIENTEVHIIDKYNVWTTADEKISMNGQSQKAVVSNIFTLTPDGWKILLDHTTYLS